MTGGGGDLAQVPVNKTLDHSITRSAAGVRVAMKVFGLGFAMGGHRRRPPAPAMMTLRTRHKRTPVLPFPRRRVAIGRSRFCCSAVATFSNLGLSLSLCVSLFNLLGGKGRDPGPSQLHLISFASRAQLSFSDTVRRFSVHLLCCRSVFFKPLHPQRPFYR